MKFTCIGALIALLTPALGSSQEIAAELSNPSALTLEAVVCRGNADTSCDFIRAKLRLHAGRELTDSDVLDAKLRLSALPNFETVDIHLEKGSARGKAILVIEVTEANSILTEFTAGLDHSSAGSNFATIGEHAAGRVSHQNLFGRQKILEFRASGGHSSSSSSGSQGFGANLRYIDPNLFSSEHFFLSLLATYGTFSSHASGSTLSFDPNTQQWSPSQYRFDSTGQSMLSDAWVGYRFWSYSYLAIGYTYMESRGHTRAIMSPAPPGDFTYRFHGNVANLAYGWDTEDDAYFPTTGSKLFAGATYALDYIGAPNCRVKCDALDWSLAYKQTWSLSRRSTLTLNIGGEPRSLGDQVQPMQSAPLGLSLAYGRSIFSNSASSRRGRWYVRVGSLPADFSRDGRIGGRPDSAYLGVGIAFESRTFGIVNLSASGRRYVRR